MAVPAVAQRRPTAHGYAAPRKRTHSFRPEIQGLRAVAIVLVVANGLLAWPHGGFVGVDVFFVISGYLITALLIKEHERAGRISVVAFYKRRVRRILPAAFVVLACTWFVSSLVFYADRAKGVHHDIGWSVLLLANVHFARTGTDYFDTSKPPSPVEHLWSLAVEEQFYLLWPLLLVVLLLLARRHSPGSKAPALGLLAVLALAILFVIAMRQTSNDRAAAFFSSQARAWELGVGVVLAFAMPYVTHLPRWACSASVAIGLAAILGSAVALSGTSTYPAPAGAAPALGAAAVILGSSTRYISPLAWPLTNPISRYVGRVSYSLYLWYWPTIVVLSTETSSHTKSFKVLAVLMIAALTVASYHLIEAPLRQLTVTDLRRLRRRLTARHKGWTEKRRALFAFIMIAEAVAVLWIERPSPTPRTFVGPAVVDAADLSTPSALRAGAIVPPKDLATAIVTALGATAWPKLNPSLGTLASAKPAVWRICGNVDASRVARCTFPAGATPGGSKTAVVIGDSVALSWLPSIRGALEPKGWTTVALTYRQCPAVDVSVNQGIGATSDFTAACNRHRTWTIAQIARLHPGLVIMSDAENSLIRLTDGASGQRSVDEWSAGVTRTLNALGKAGARHVVILSPPPAGQSLEVCATKDSTPGDCVTQVSDTWRGMAAAEYAAAANGHARYVDTELLFCSGEEYCPAFIGGIPVRIDGYRMVADYAVRVGPLLTKRLLP